MKSHWIAIFSILFAAISCSTNSGKNAEKTEETATPVEVPTFNADSAYAYIQAQVNFGPRIPNTQAHVEAGNYLATKLAEFGANVSNQYVDLSAYDGTILKARNIIGSYKPETKKRVLLFAHWDTRPWADNDPNPENHRKPILGANDGASGVGVLLEIARQINLKEPTIGIDIIFFDAEDYGIPQFHQGNYMEDTWALGSQYWSRYPHISNYKARYGILLDMVGGKDAKFYREGYSDRYAKSIVDKVWNTAQELGYGSYFVNRKGGPVTDDHYYVNEIAGIRSIDIIPYDETGDSSFGYFWHTVEDNINVISKPTLEAVGQTVMTVIYNEK